MLVKYIAQYLGTECSVSPVPRAMSPEPAGGTHWMCLKSPRCSTVLECHTLQDTSKLQHGIRRPVRVSNLPGIGAGPAQTPLSHWVQLPTPCTGPGLSPVQNEDFVWHPVLGTLLSLFLGTGPAGQVCKA